jgi:ABC-type antimicrobial peptide transport system permease subunit
MYFTPEAQADYKRSAGALFLHDIVIVAKPGASMSAASVLQAMTSVDPNLPVISIRTLREQVASQFTQPRLIARLTSFFGILSLLLAYIGLYGVTAYNAGCRSSEIGVRVALGANRGNIVWLILRGSLALIFWGLLLGLPLTLAVSPCLATQLYGTNPYDPVVLLTSILALGLSVLVASLIPAFRASLTSPLDALRAE